MACPICCRDAHDSYRPFCSKRCADVDLARWLTGSYAFPGPDAEEQDTTPDAQDAPLRRPH